jgi:hypothetical protein
MRRKGRTEDAAPWCEGGVWGKRNPPPRPGVKTGDQQGKQTLMSARPDQTALPTKSWNPSGAITASGSEPLALAMPDPAAYDAVYPDAALSRRMRTGKRWIMAKMSKASSTPQ